MKGPEAHFHLGSLVNCLSVLVRRHRLASFAIVARATVAEWPTVSAIVCPSFAVVCYGGWTHPLQCYGGRIVAKRRFRFRSAGLLPVYCLLLTSPPTLRFHIDPPFSALDLPILLEPVDNAPDFAVIKSGLFLNLGC